VTVLAGPPANTAPPTVAGPGRAATIAMCEAGSWTNSPTGCSVRWLLDGRRVATGAGLTVPDAYPLSCTVAVVWNGGTTAAVAARAVSVPVEPPVALLEPIPGGTPRAGATLTCARGTWKHAGTFAIAWLRDGDVVATGPSYALSAADAGHWVSCRMTAVGRGGTVTIASHPLGVAAAVATPAPRAMSSTGRDRLDGGAGNDVLDARDGRGGDVVRCGPGRDRALVDRGGPRRTRLRVGPPPLTSPKVQPAPSNIRRNRCAGFRRGLRSAGRAGARLPPTLFEVMRAMRPPRMVLRPQDALGAARG